MSAAAPPPYPTNDGLGGYNNARRPSSSNSNGGDRAFKHLEDLKREALTGFNRNGNIHELVSLADRALNMAQNILTQYRRPDLSYVEYLRASEIVVEAMPHNKGWPDFQLDHGGGGMQKYQMLQKRINAMGEQYANIKEIIVNNNMRNGIQPTGGAGGGHARTESVQQVNGNSMNGLSAAHKIKPVPSPKPEKMHGRALSPAPAGAGSTSNSAISDALVNRFAQLRRIDTSRPDSRSTNPSSVHSSPISMPHSSDIGSRSSIDALSRLSSAPGARPQGPRGMPNGDGPPVPGRIPLDTSIVAALPQAPQATYSPARNMQTTGDIELPRHTPRSLASTSTRRSSMAPTSSASSQAPNGIYSESRDYFPAPASSTSNSVPPPQVPRRKSVNVPQETRISAERLFDYLERFNILVIDFRSRQDFDQGHISAPNVICIEPLHVTRGMSADELLERMVIGPDSETEMFANREKYELVVYYDAETQSENYLTHPTSEPQEKLKYLDEALCDFNEDKPLQRLPMLLIGGLDAWKELNQILKTSDTVGKAKQGRPISRRPVLGTGQLRPSKRRLRDYNPLDDEEAHKWQEQARAESVVLPGPNSFAGSEDVIQEEVEDGEEDPGSAIRDFRERFPEAESLEGYAFGPLQPNRAAPEPPPKVPIQAYPPTPSPANYPSIPARPQPAAPRPSYTGVSDRAGAQNAPSTRSSSLVPYIPPKYLATNLRLPKTGLDNFRFTCYMNATLQALSATTPLSIFFLDDYFRGLLQRENWKGTKGVLTELYSNLVRSMWKGDVNYIRPTTFRKFCGRLNREWGRDDQEQDAKEFFDFLIDCLHEDLNGMWARTPLRELTVQEEARREKMPKMMVAKTEWGRFTHRDQSFITSLFGGQYSSRLYFDTCGHTSTKHEAFYALSVEIPNISGRQISLDDCLRSYCSQERLTDDDRAKCDQCNMRRDSTKQIMITRAPQFLVVHFKRFHTSGRSTRKIHAPVNFPLENFDLEPYMIRQPSSSEAEAMAKDYGADALKTDPSMTPPYKYDAYAVVRHIGSTIQSGHYTALVKDRARGVWRCFNDRSSEDFLPGQGRYRANEDPRNGQAYIVFYQRSTGAQMQQTPVGKI